MRIKVLLYPLTHYEIDKLSELVEPLEGEGFEIAFATDNLQLIPRLSVSKVVVVNPKTWEFDFAITMQDTLKPKGKCIVYKEQELVDLYGEIEDIFA